MNPQLLEPKTLGPIILEAAEKLCTQKPSDWDATHFSCIQLREALSRAELPEHKDALEHLYWVNLFEGSHEPSSGLETVEDRLDVIPCQMEAKALQVRLMMLALFHTLVESGDIHQFNTP